MEKEVGVEKGLHWKWDATSKVENSSENQVCK
jgi:hypothetical protein